MDESGFGGVVGMEDPPRGEFSGSLGVGGHGLVVVMIWKHA